MEELNLDKIRDDLNTIGSHEGEARYYTHDDNNEPQDNIIYEIRSSGFSAGGFVLMVNHKDILVQKRLSTVIKKLNHLLISREFHLV